MRGDKRTRRSICVERVNCLLGGIHRGEPIESWKQDAKNNPKLAARIDWLYHRPAEELYDLQSDPYEMTNLAENPQFASIKAGLGRELDAWMAQQGDKGMETEVAATSRQNDTRQERAAGKAKGNAKARKAKKK